MRLLCLCLFFYTVTAQAGFGKSYLGNSRLCHKWACLNEKLNLEDSLPPKEHYAEIIRSLLPSGDGHWKAAANLAVDTCYGNRTKKYTNTCPGQALLHCTIDQLVENCPNRSWVRQDGCSPVSSVSSYPYMFSQGRYVNLEGSIQNDRRPEWFLKHYFKSKCCDLPQMFNDSVLSQCGFNKLMLYHIHETQLPPYRIGISIQESSSKLGSTRSPLVKLGVFRYRPYPPLASTEPSQEDEVQTRNLLEQEYNKDPLDCCDMHEFISSEWRASCEFHTKWHPTKRLSILDSLIPTTTTTPRPTSTPVTHHDIKIVALPCEQQNCIYRKLNIISESGEVNLVEFAKLLDNLTNYHPEWMKAKARVVTKCLTRPLLTYEADCPISNVLSCTADVLSENCPNLPQSDPCKHSNPVTDGIPCQISASKYGPRNRHLFCALPNLVNREVLTECGADYTWSLEYVPAPVKPKSYYKKWVSSISCQDLTMPAACLMSKMDVLNKYGFVDSFKMKDRIREFSQGEWSHLDVYTNAVLSVPLYREYCSSPKKLLNVIDAMLLTCPLSRRDDSEQCRRIFEEVSNSPNNMTKEEQEQIMKHFQHVYIPDLSQYQIKRTEPPKKLSVKTNPLYDFGIFSNEDTPKVRLIDVKPNEKKPLVLLPVYKRMGGTPLNQLNNDGILRG